MDAWAERDARALVARGVDADVAIMRAVRRAASLRYAIAVLHEVMLKGGEAASRVTDSLAKAASAAGCSGRIEHVATLRLSKWLVDNPWELKKAHTTIAALTTVAQICPAPTSSEEEVAELQTLSEKLAEKLAASSRLWISRTTILGPAITSAAVVGIHAMATHKANALTLTRIQVKLFHGGRLRVTARGPPCEADTREKRIKEAELAIQAVITYARALEEDLRVAREDDKERLTRVRQIMFEIKAGAKGTKAPPHVKSMTLASALEHAMLYCYGGWRKGRRHQRKLRSRPGANGRSKRRCSRISTKQRKQCREEKRCALTGNFDF